MKKDAIISECGVYRYCLAREWDGSLSACSFLMLNPSTADAEQDDPTIRRCIGFAKAWGFGTLLVYNIFALRATDPLELQRVDDPVGPMNDEHLSYMPDPVIAAWGAWGNLHNRGNQMRKRFPGRLNCLGTTKSGEPKHPLYLKASTERTLLK